MMQPSRSASCCVSCAPTTPRWTPPLPCPGCLGADADVEPPQWEEAPSERKPSLIQFRGNAYVVEPQCVTLRAWLSRGQIACACW